MVCRPASSVIATKGMPRQTLAAMTEARAFVGIAEEIDAMVDDAELDQRPGDDRELGIVDPPEGDGRQHGRHHPGQQDHGAEEGLQRQVLVQEQRQPEAEHEFQDRGADRVEQRVEDREPEDGVVPEIFVVLQADEDAGTADAGVGEAEPDAEAERIGEEDEEQRCRRQHEAEGEETTAFREPL